MRRLLAAGHARRVCAVLLGDWPTPTRKTVTTDGTAGEVTGAVPPELAGARLFTVPRHDALDLLDALTRPTDPPHTLPPTTPDSGDDTVDHRADDGDSVTGAEARAVADAVGRGATGPVLSLRVFGRLSLRYSPADEVSSGRELGERLSDRRRELLTYLALHPGGVRRGLLIEHLWPDVGIERPTAPLNAALTRLRSTLSRLTGQRMHDLIVTGGDGHYRFNPDLVTVDYHRFTAALGARNTAHTAADRMRAVRAMLAEYRGELAPALDAEWIEAPRRHAAHTAVTAVADLARHLAEHGDPEQAVTVLEHAVAVIDPYNEALYTQLICLHRDQGRPDAARRVYADLETELATIQTTPSRDVRDLLSNL
jgi:DNA-binding SARP family transcriptional activator